MGDQNIRRTGANPGAKADSSSGYTVDPGPYEAIVMKHVTGNRMGQLMVKIPNWGSIAPDDPDSQILASYASPFHGVTYGANTQSLPEGAWTNGQSYGMWMVPPDIGNRVLVTFAAGDRSRAYWFACIYDGPNHHMIPGMARSIGGPDKTSLDKTQSGPLLTNATSTSSFPVVEYNLGEPGAFNTDALTNTTRYAHPYQSMVLLIQGLDRDKVRGAISSSSLREAPSNVYGISTPGRSASGNKAQFNTVPGGYMASQAVYGRVGGHQFVMDDGDENGVDQLVRLRTTGGHQILMNDTEKILYIASSTGNQWLEFSDNGAINIYGAAGINMRSQGPMQFHSDSGIIMNSGGPIAMNGDMGVNIHSLTSVQISSMISASVATDGILSLSAVGAASLTAGGLLSMNSDIVTYVSGLKLNLNSPMAPKPPTPVPPIVPNSLTETKYNNKYWEINPGALKSICTVAPAHEPWIDPSTGKRPDPVTSGNKASALIGAATSLGAVAAAKFLF